MATEEKATDVIMTDEMEAHLAELEFYSTKNDLTRRTYGNHLKLGLVGYPSSGKTYLFNHLVGRNETVDESLYTTLDYHVGITELRDERLDWLCKNQNAKQVTKQFATVVDTPALVGGAHIGNGLGFDTCYKMRGVDIICLVLRAFDDDNITHIEGTVDPVRDLRALDQELKVHDLRNIEAAIHKTENIKVPTREDKFILTVLYRAYGCLIGEDYGEPKERMKTRLGLQMMEKKQGLKFRTCPGLGLRNERWTPREVDVLEPLDLLTGKQVIVIPNYSARDYNRDPELDKFTSDIRKVVDEELGGGKLCRMSAVFETRLVELGKESAKALKLYLRANPRHRTGIHNLFLTCIHALDLIRFYDLGKDMIGTTVQAFYCRSNDPITTAAGKVDATHEIFFTFAQIMTYGDYFQVGGSLDEIKMDGKLRSQGPKYTMFDGDIVDFSLCSETVRKAQQSKKDAR